MARTIIEINGKKFQVCENRVKRDPCRGCIFFDGVLSNCPGPVPPCFEFDDATGTLHIIKTV